MGGDAGIKRLLLGINVTILGGVLVMAASGSAVGLGLLVAIGGLLISISVFR